jgi:hypothetical protein
VAVAQGEQTHKTDFLVVPVVVVLRIPRELVQAAQGIHLQQVPVKEIAALIVPHLMLAGAAALVRLAPAQTVALEQHHQLLDHL